MQTIYFIKAISIAILINTSSFAQQDNTIIDESKEESISIQHKKKLNFFIIAKRKKGKLDLATRFNVFRTKVKSMFRKEKFVSIVAKDAEQMSVKVQYRLNKYNSNIGTIWFDSHGMYKKGYSLFFIGHNEYNYKTLKDSSLINPIKQLASYADENTKVIIGSCYGGATYQRASINYKDTTRMNGDSLMIALGKIFEHVTVYACESWVMTKPGLFLKRAAVAGFPGRKLFRDVCYKPVWENIGIWNEYNTTTNKFSAINPITLDMYGNAIVRTISYTNKACVKKDVMKNLSNLGIGLYK